MNLVVQCYNLRTFSKLTSMIQDVIKGDIEIARRMDYENFDFNYPSEYDERLEFLENNVQSLEHAVSNWESIIGMKSMMKNEDEENMADEFKTEDMMNRLEKLDEGLNVSESKARVNRRSIPESIDLVDINENLINLKKDVTSMKERIDQLNGKVDGIFSENGIPAVGIETKSSPTPGQEGERGADSPIDHSHGKVDDIVPQNEKSVVDIPEKQKGQGADSPKGKSSKKKSPEINLHSDKRIEKLEQDVTVILDKLQDQMEGDSNDDEMKDLNNNVDNIQKDLNKLTSTVEKMLNDNGNRETRNDALIEQIDLLKITKADKEDLEDALADKANIQIVDQKVSQDQFDAIYHDLNDDLENTNAKLDEQQTTWQQMINDIQNEIENKADKFEIVPFKDFVNDQLKLIQEEIKIIADAQNDNEAAGSKKFIRDLQCVSCDRNAVMRMEQNVNFRTESFPCTLSIKPYLTYELDQVRDQQKKFPTSRNMIQFEAAGREYTHKLRNNDNIPKDHLCNRYCGGSHTILNPQQKVMRTGHFTNEWKAETAEPNEKWIKGTDGKLYHGRPKSTTKCKCELNNRKSDEEFPIRESNNDKKRISK